MKLSVAQLSERGEHRRSEADFGVASVRALARLQVPVELREREREPHAPLLRLPFDRIDNQAVRFVAWVLACYGHEAKAVQHPCRTFTCAEKAQLIEDYDHQELYGCYGPIRIAQGTLLLVHDKHQPERYMVYLHDGAERINFKELKEECHVSKKGDIRMFKGSPSEVQRIVGLEPGSISPFVAPWSQLSSIRFASHLLQSDSRYPGTLYDFAFAQDKSLLIQPDVLLYCLRQHPHFHQLIPMLPAGRPPSKRMPDLDGLRGHDAGPTA